MATSPNKLIKPGFCRENIGIRQVSSFLVFTASFENALAYKSLDQLANILVD